MDVLDTEITNELLSQQSDSDSPLDNTLNPLYWDLRITFSDQTEKHEYLDDKGKLKRWKYISVAVKEVLLNYAYLGKITGGLEVRNKLGENTRAHVHFRFHSTTLKDTMVKPLKRILRDTYDLETTGNKHFYFKSSQEINNDKFFRYPLKQSYQPSLSSGFAPSQLELMHKIAYDSYLITIQINQKKKDNKDPSDTLFERLCEKLKSENLKELKPTIVRTIQFYCDESRPLNRQTIVGYSQTYLVKEKHLSAEALADSWL